MIKKILKVGLCFTCFVALFSFVPLKVSKSSFYAVYASDYDEFAENESYYNSLCTSTNLSDEDKSTCQDYQEYLEDKAQSYEDSIADINAQIAEIEADIENQLSVISELNAQIDEVQEQIDDLQDNIDVIEANIEEIDEQIAEREARIEELNEQIKSRMAANQSNVSTNAYISFIMGASSFVDLIRRVSAYNEITSYDMEKIEELEEEKVLLQADIDALEEQKDLLVEQQDTLESYQDTLEEMEATAQQLLTAYRAADAEAKAAREEAQDLVDQLEGLMDDITENLASYTTSSGWAYYFKNVSFYITSACFYYESTYGSFHPAVDAVASTGTGTPVYATANGVVVATYSGCTSSSGLSCGNNHGNYVEYVVVVNDVAYLVISQHLKDVYVSVGDIVAQSVTVLGTQGNTGYSTGSHLHQCVIRMGNMTITEAVRSFQSVNKYYYGLSYSISSACYVKGSAPCYEDAEDIYGTYYHHRYYG